MNTWLISDIHGCFYTLMRLLDTISISSTDRLIFLGDYVNKGPHSLECLNWLSHNSYTCLMGNNDLGLLYYLLHQPDKAFLEPFHAAANKIDLIDWLKNLSWGIVDATEKAIYVHAGVDPRWTVTEIDNYFTEASDLLVNDDQFLKNVLTKPTSPLEKAAWVFTHIRFIDAFNAYSHVTLPPPQPGLTPWFEKDHKHTDYRVYFGHWASLEAQFFSKDYCALDGACVYGKNLVAYNTRTKYYHKQPRDPRDI